MIYFGYLTRNIFFRIETHGINLWLPLLYKNFGKIKKLMEKDNIKNIFQIYAVRHVAVILFVNFFHT